MKCGVCDTSAAYIQCACGFGACGECCKQYAIPSCMSCRVGFTRSFLQRVAPKLVKDVYRPYHETLFWEREKGLLANTQVLVEWEEKTLELKKRLRFGETVVFPIKPITNLSNTGTFACPEATCRGFVSGASCGVCKARICTACREIDHQLDDPHVCKPETLESIKVISMDSKPCPSCATAIFRIDGCNHMFCTHCRTHWDWVSGQVLRASTNHHYLNTAQFARNVATRNVRAECEENIMSHAVLEYAVPASHRGEVFRYLYTEIPMVRSLAMLYDERVITMQHTQALINLRHKFLRKLCTEDDAKSKVFVLEQQFQKKQDCAAILRIFLLSIYDLQIVWRSKHWKEEPIVDLLKNLVSGCNECTEAICTEYGGVVPRFQCNSGPFATLQ